jgi:uncharacterized OsmC-like protein
LYSLIGGTEKMKKMIVGLLIAFILSVSISNVFASGGGSPISVPEPLGYILIAAGGASIAGVRYWLAKRRCKRM